MTAQYTAKKPASDEVAATASHAEDGVLTNHMGNAQPISDEKLKELRRKYDKDRWIWIFLVGIRRDLLISLGV